MKPRVTAYWYYETAEQEDTNDQVQGFMEYEADTDDYRLSFKDITIEGQPSLEVSVWAGVLDGYYSVTIIRDGINICNVAGLLGNYLNVWTIMPEALHFFVHIESKPIIDSRDGSESNQPATP